MSLTIKRTAWAGAGLALLIAIFSFPGAQALASDFLGLFRVQKFAAVSISPEQLKRLSELDMEGLYPGEITMLDEMDAPLTVASLEEAAAQSGFQPLAIATLGKPDSIQVMDGGRGQLTIDLATSRTMLEIAGVDPALLPDSLDGAQIDATVYTAVGQHWETDNVLFMQMPSPEIAYPDDFDPAPLGQALLQMLGMSEPEAASLARSIDWTSTLLLPIPQDMASFAEVTVNGAAGLLLTGVDEGIDGQNAAVIWENNGVIYFLASPNFIPQGLLELAEAVQ